MATTTITVEGMTCEHCVAAVRDELVQLPGVNDLQIDLETGQVRIESDSDLDPSALEAAVDEAGYELLQ